MKLHNLDLNKLAVFCQVVESGNFRRAGEVLNVTPSALSQSIAILEHALGFELFDRVGRRLKPTEKGSKLHREFRASQASLATALDELTGESEKVSGLLRIGAYLEFAKSRLAPQLARFIAAHPDVQVKMTFDSPSRLQKLLEEGQLDLCFSIYPAREKKRIRSEKIYQQELVLVSPPSLLPAQASFAEVMAAPIIDYYMSHQLIRRWIDLHFQKKPKAPPIRIFAATAEMVLALVQEGAGAGVVPAYLAKGPELKRSVRIVRPTAKRLEDFIWLLSRASPKEPGLIKTFRAEIEREALI